MLLRTIVALLLSVLLFFGDGAIAQAQMINNRQSTQRRESVAATRKTVPTGIRYNRDALRQRSPSLSQMEGASEAGTIQFPDSIPTRYNMQRAWSRGATPDRIVKFGDLKSNPTLSKVLNISQMTLRSIATKSGADIERMPLKSIGLINNMTVAEFFETFPELENASVRNVPILAETFYRIGRNPTQLRQIALDTASKKALAQLSALDPRLGQIPLGEMASGDWDGALAAAKRRALGELIQSYPELENFPISEVLNGNWEGAGRQALDTASRKVLEELAVVDPRLGQVPLGEVINGDWDGALAQVEKVAVQELVKVNPALENLPISEVMGGNWEGAGRRVLDAAQQALVEKLAGNPVFENIPVSDLARGNWKGALTTVAQQQLQNLLAENPDLAGLPADKLFPIVNGAISGDWNSVIRQASNMALQKGMNMASKELLESVPELADTPLGALPISNLTVGDIMGFADKPLATIAKISNRYLSQLGHLSQVPGTMFAIDSAMILLTGDVFGRLDIPYAGPVETPIARVLTGGTRNQLFLPEPCTEESCKHFELADVWGGPGGLGDLNGKAWIQGTSQSVPGGKGFLTPVNGGKERTGVPVWSTDAHTKLSLENINEGGGGKPGTALVWMNFQVCVYPPFMGEHCTPHFLPVPTPWQVSEGSLMLVFSRASVPDFIQDARDLATSDYQDRYGQEVCDSAGSGSYAPPISGGETSPSNGNNSDNLKQYLARIAAGESGGGRNIGPNPDTGAYGEYQFTPSSRKLLMDRYPDLDPWSTDKSVRDRAAVKWIALIGEERKVDILDAISKGDFATADRVLGKHVYDSRGRIVQWGQFTSLPGGAEEHTMWRNRANLAKYGANGSVQTGTDYADGLNNPCERVAGLPGSDGELISNGDGKVRGKFINPVGGGVRYPITSGFGSRDIGCNRSKFHPAVDLGTPTGTSVKAADGGVVTFAGNVSGYGYTVVVDHGNGVKTRYSHLDSYGVRQGSRVSQGQVIAKSGNSDGNTDVSTGEHLDFGIYLNDRTGMGQLPIKGNAVDPRKYIDF